jgi:ATP-dependent DNA helicase RecG
VKSVYDDVETLKGIGNKKAAALSTLGIHTVMDLLTYYPFRYDDFKVKNMDQIKDQEKVTLEGVVASGATVSYLGKRRNILSFRLLINHDIVRVTFFNQPWLKKQLVVGHRVLVYGRFNKYKLSLTGIKILAQTFVNNLEPIYPANKQIKQTTITSLVKMAFSEYNDVINDLIPLDIMQKYHLEHQRQMIHDMHFPKNQQSVILARRTAKFLEFFLFQMRLQSLKQVHKSNSGVELDYDIKIIRNFIEKLPFQLTTAQTRVINDILADMKSPRQMNRLLQGDVGSGKTIVAAVVILACVSAGHQAALMVPTEILAEQHANKLIKIFKGFSINVALLTGSTKVSAKKELLKHIRSGEVDLIVGTHAIIQAGVKYKDLGLGIIDEQHRFGVTQRAALREKNKGTNMLSMTATPIPRTLAITTYGEMDISVINELPRGRKVVQTAWIREKQFSSALPFITNRLKKGEQIYVVVPLIEESEAVDMRNAIDVYQKFQTIFNSDYNVALLHGKMRDAEKNAMMEEFKRGTYQILVSTTVIEVGVDVSNATMMIIFNADHFGLAQLHQLRGRVGRGSSQSYCLLISDPKTENGSKRMDIMVRSNDGFFIAQKDLELRGSGDIMGISQSGMPNFTIGDPVADLTMLNIAQQEAINIVSKNDWKRMSEYEALQEYIYLKNQQKKFD